MLWCAASERLNEDIERLGASGFLTSDRDRDMLSTCLNLKLLTQNRERILRNCLGDRNDCAHPSGRIFRAEEVVGYLKDLNRALFGYQLRIAQSTFKKIVLTGKPLSPEQASFLTARLRINQRVRRLPHALVDKYFEAGPRIREKIRLIWQADPLKGQEELEEPQEQRLKEHLRLSRQEQVAVMGHLARKLRGADATGNYHQPVEIAQLIFWEALYDDEASAAIFEYFLSQRKYLTLSLGRKLLRYAPDRYREQLDVLFGAL